MPRFFRVAEDHPFAEEHLPRTVKAFAAVYIYSIITLASSKERGC
jgi:hypothetical protein